MNERQCVVCELPISGQKVKFCSNKCKQKSHYRSVSGQTNSYLSQTRRGLTRKLSLMDERGGGCEICGYNKNVGAIEFHHKDQNEKDGGLDMRKLSNSTMEWIRIEFEKCLVLCSNCHREHHNPECETSLVRTLVNSVQNIVRANVKGKPNCIDCGKQVNYNSERCKPCLSKSRHKVKHPDKSTLQQEMNEYGVTWCSEKYGVSRKSIHRWLSLAA